MRRMIRHRRPSPTPVPATTPIPASQIPALTGEFAGFLRGIEASVRPQEEIIEIADALPATKERVDELEIEVLPLFEDEGPPLVLKDTEADLLRVERRLTGRLDTLNARTLELDGFLADFKQRRELWELTRDEADAAELPEALIQQVTETVAAIEKAEKTIRERRSEVLTLQAELVALRSRLRALSDRIAKEVEIRQLDLLRLDSPPVWRALGGAR